MTDNPSRILERFRRTINERETVLLYGIPIEDLSKAELITAVKAFIARSDSESKEHIRQLRVLNCRV